MSTPSTQIGSLLTSAVAALLLSGLASLKNQTEVARSGVRPHEAGARVVFEDVLEELYDRVNAMLR